MGGGGGELKNDVAGAGEEYPNSPPVYPPENEDAEPKPKLNPDAAGLGS